MMKKMMLILLLILGIFIVGCAKGQIVGGDRDAHGCIGSAGYSWCEEKQKCLRPWEENCTETVASNTSAGELGIKQDISISGFAFDPDTITIPRGATVTWTNKDPANHAIKSDLFESELFSKGESWSHTFNEAGTIEYYCTVHPSMKGTIIVE